MHTHPGLQYLSLINRITCSWKTYLHFRMCVCVKSHFFHIQLLLVHVRAMMRLASALVALCMAQAAHAQMMPMGGDAEQPRDGNT